ncbi:unnamed protein product [Heterobilharzia americana]|nr:unnamed protein product [Heterobilharzia americana]
MPHLIGLGASVLPYRSTLVRVSEIRVPWNGRISTVRPEDRSQANTLTASFMKESSVEPANLQVPGILHRHSICIPAYLSRIATSPESHSTLAKFCGAPCLIQCDSEPFLPGTFAKLILGDKENSSDSGQHAPAHADSGSVSPSLCLSTYTWPSPSLISQSAIMNLPHIAGVLSPAGITDPNILLTGLPGTNGPLVLLHIWSGSTEAIRRATFLELGHVRLLAVRYHLLRNLSKGETGELELSTNADFDEEDGDAPAMHCKPISIPAAASNDKQAPGGMIIGYECRFRILPHLIGLAIGHRGATIQEARGIPGVRVVNLLYDGIVHVEAELSKEYSSLVWSTTMSEADRLMALNDSDFIQALNDCLAKPSQQTSQLATVFSKIGQCFGGIVDYLGNQSKSVDYESYETTVLSAPHVDSIQPNTKRACYPLGFQHATVYSAPRLALVGDSAHRILPLAGQGVNLGFGDVVSLVAHLEEAIRHGADIGSAAYLKDYTNERQRIVSAVLSCEQNKTSNCQDSTVSCLVKNIFSDIRGAGMSTVQSSELLKKILMEVAVTGKVQVPSSEFPLSL